MFGAGAVLGAASKYAKEVERVSDEMRSASANGGALAKSMGKVEEASAKVADNQLKQNENSARIAELTKQRNALEKSSARATKQNASDAGDLRQKYREVKAEINRLNSSQRGLAGVAGRYKRELNGANRELVETNRQLDKAIRKQQKLEQQRSRGSRFGRGALAGAALSDLPGSGVAQQIGAGFLVGGKAGAVGAGLSAIASGLIGLAKPAAIATAELQRLEIALSAVAGSNTPAALKAIDRAVDDFNIPLQDATKNFTQLVAAGAATGNTVGELETLYRGLAAATKATGGDAEDLNGVLRAATQVLSKNKVQAEELRGQIGDRLPGAFALFAEATGRSSKELDKALADGEVSAQEFVTKFGKFIKEKYEPAAKKIGSSPAEAGARLQKALDDANRKAGPALAELGAKIQDFATDSLNALAPLGEYFANLFNIGQQGNLDAYKNSLADLLKLDEQITKKEAFIAKAIEDGAGKGALQALEEDLASLNRRRNELTKKIALQNSSLPNNQVETKVPAAGTVKVGDIVGGAEFNGPAPSAPSGFFDEANEFNDLLERQEESRKRIFQALTRELALGRDISDTQRTLLQLDYEILDLKNDISSTVAKSDQAELFALAEKLRKQKELNILKERNARIMFDFETIFAEGQAIDDAIKGPFEELASQTVPMVGQAIQDSIVTAIEAAVKGTDDLNESLQAIASSLLKQLGGLFLNAGFNGLGGALKLPGYANGGVLPSNGPAIVGENGPELAFSNGGQTTIVPMDDAFGAARASMFGDAPAIDLSDDGESLSAGDSYYNSSNSSVSNAYAASSAAMNRTTERIETTASERAFMEVVSATGLKPIDIRIEETVINEQRYTTPEQTAAAVQAGVKQAQAQLMASLQNNPGARRKIGI